jgi:hypothetical protein
MYIQYIQGLFQSRLGTADYALVTSSLLYIDSLVTWTVIHMTALMFKPLIFLSLSAYDSPYLSACLRASICQCLRVSILVVGSSICQCMHVCVCVCTSFSQPVITSLGTLSVTELFYVTDEYEKERTGKGRSRNLARKPEGSSSATSGREPGPRIFQRRTAVDNKQGDGVRLLHLQHGKPKGLR